MEDSIKGALNEHLKGDIRSLDHYTHVRALTLWWEDGDYPGFKTEAEDVKDLFEQEYHFAVDTFPIPSKRSQICLDSKISQFIMDHDAEGSLLILHYGGHGDEDDDRDRDCRSVWAAQSSGGPTVEWFLIQPKFDHVEADVLLLLDCCFAAQAARARQIPKRVELLAACAMGVQAPPPGDRSFTTILIKELKKALSSPNGISVARLNSNLLKKESGYRRSPVHVDLGSGTSKSICITPLKTEGHVDLGETQGQQLTLQITLRDFITKSSLPSIVQWLKHQAPSIVLRMSVEKIVSQTEKVKQVVFDQNHSSRSRGSISLEHMDDSAKKDIVQSWIAFATLLAGADRLFNQSQQSTSEFGYATKEPRRDAISFISALEARLSALTETIKEHMLGTEYLSDKETLVDHLKDPPSEFDMSALIKMRLLALFPELPEEVVLDELQTATAAKSGTVTAAIMAQFVPPLGQVLVEYKGICDGDTAVSKLSDYRVRQLADLLSFDKPNEFRALKCIKSFKPAGLDRYGLAFEIPEGYHAEPTSLLDMIHKLPILARPTLGQRFDIAFKICQAVANWHRVGWVLQSVASFNVVFFRRRSDEKSHKHDYSSPYICGFEYSRPDGAPSLLHVAGSFDRAIYYHPSRQGIPSSTHRKVHDLYSLGVVLLEIGLWRPMANLFPISGRIKIEPSDMQTTLLSNARTRLAHYMGRSYARATISCLSGDFGVKVDDEVESQLSLAFNRMVITPIAQAVGVD